MNFNVSINLLKLKAAIMAVQGKEKVKKCLVIPIEDNDLYSRVSEDGKVSVYLSLSCWENRQSKYGDTHLVKQSHSKEWNDSHSEEERQGEPILGNARPIVEKTLDQVNVPTAPVAPDVPFVTGNGTDEDLPF